MGASYFRIRRPLFTVKCIFILSVLMLMILMSHLELSLFDRENNNKSPEGAFHLPQKRIILDINKNQLAYIYGDTDLYTWKSQMDYASLVSDESKDKSGNRMDNQNTRLPVNTISTQTKLRSPEKDALDLASLVTEMSLRQHVGHDSLTRKLKHFKTAMTERDKSILLDIAKTFDEFAQKWNISYFLYGGALLGSYRHHGIIPWDDDLDVFINLKHRDLLFSIINASSNYDIFIAGPRMKMWSKDSKQVTKYPWRWPYLDISIYDENDTHIWDIAEEYQDYIYPKSIVFPLHKRPLAGYFFQSPRDAFANIKLTYKSSDCTTHHYSHKLEKILKGKRKFTIPCDLLYNTIPFVHRSSSEHGTRETLMLGNYVIHSLVVDEPRYAITESYRLKLINI